MTKKSRDRRVFDTERIQNQLAQLAFNAINKDSYDGKKYDKFHMDEFGQWEQPKALSDEDKDLLIQDLFITGQAMTLTTADGIKRIEPPFTDNFEG